MKAIFWESAYVLLYYGVRYFQNRFYTRCERGEWINDFFSTHCNMRWYPSRTMVAANGALDADKKKYSRPRGNRIKISAHARRLALANARALHTISLSAGIKSNGILCLGRRYRGRKAIKPAESSDRAIEFMLSPEVRIALHVYAENSLVYSF